MTCWRSSQVPAWWRLCGLAGYMLAALSVCPAVARAQAQSGRVVSDASHRSSYDAFMKVNRLKEDVGEEGDTVEYWGLILNRLQNQAGRNLIKRPEKDFSEDAFFGWMMFVTSYGNNTGIGNCAACHRTPAFTDGQEYDIGTGGPVEAPSLRDIADKGSYFHNESASTLEEAIATHVANGRIARQDKRRGVHLELGKIALTEEEIEKVAAFVRTLRTVDSEKFREYLIDVVVQPLEFEY